MKKLNPKIIIPIALALVCSVVLIFIGDGGGENDTVESVCVADYRSELENSLVSIIGKIKGVGTVDVILSIECGTEYVYAVDTSENESSRTSEYHKAGERDSLLIKEISPKVRGVAVVCDGGDNIDVKNKIILLVSSLLDISSNNIFVGS